jgi:hypothetical protein
MFVVMKRVDWGGLGGNAGRWNPREDWRVHCLGNQRVVVGDVKELIEPKMAPGRGSEGNHLVRHEELDCPEDECFLRLGER